MSPGIRITGTAQHRAARERTLPPVERLRGGLWCIPVPLPTQLIRHVYVYAFELPDGVALVDAGWDTEEAYRVLADGLAVGGFSVRDVKAVLATHVHADHYGLADRVRRESGAWVGLHPADAKAILEEDDEAAWEGLRCAARELRARVGSPDADGEPRVSMRTFMQHAVPDRLIEDGERIGLPGWDLRAVWTPGHTAGHLCYVERRNGLLFSGDHVLPRISPNVSVTAQQRLNPLADYLGSLRRVAEVEAAEVLPGHEYRFEGLRNRVDELTSHNTARLAEIESLLADGVERTCWQIAARLSWSRPFDVLSGFNQRSAAAETHAHLVWLAQTDRIRCLGGAPERWSAGSAASG
ncbi:MBL fold metallo-hydrolase [Streptomyces sp. NPDC002586]